MVLDDAVEDFHDFVECGQREFEHRHIFLEFLRQDEARRDEDERDECGCSFLDCRDEVADFSDDFVVGRSVAVSEVLVHIFENEDCVVGAPLDLHQRLQDVLRVFDLFFAFGVAFFASSFDDAFCRAPEIDFAIRFVYGFVTDFFDNFLDSIDEPVFFPCVYVDNRIA